MTISPIPAPSALVSRRSIATLVLITVLLGVHADVAAAASSEDYVHIRTRQLAMAEDAATFDGFVLPDDTTGDIAPSDASTSTTDVVKTYVVDSTAYTSSVEECDSDPFTTADGSKTHDGIIAANFLPFGTKVRIPALFGDKIFEVHDRMNARYWYRIDVWMEKKVDMLQYGIHHNVKIEIVQMGDGKTQWKKLAKAK